MASFSSLLKRVARRASPPRECPPQEGQGLKNPWVLALKTMVRGGPACAAEGLASMSASKQIQKRSFVVNC